MIKTGSISPCVRETDGWVTDEQQMAGWEEPLKQIYEAYF